MYIPATNHELLVSDTIGFIQDLPPSLIKSFSSTLEETIDAELLLNVIDCSDPKMEQKIKVVNEILGQIDALHKPTIYVFNKTDNCPANKITQLKQKFKNKHACLCFSATTGERMEDLKKIIAETIEYSSRA